MNGVLYIDKIYTFYEYLISNEFEMYFIRNIVCLMFNYEK